MAVGSGQDAKRTEPTRGSEVSKNTREKEPQELGQFGGELQKGIGSQHFLNSQPPRHTRS